MLTLTMIAIIVTYVWVVGLTAIMDRLVNFVYKRIKDV